MSKRKKYQKREFITGHEADSYVAYDVTIQPPYYTGKGKERKLHSPWMSAGIKLADCNRSIYWSFDEADGPAKLKKARTLINEFFEKTEKALKEYTKHEKYYKEHSSGSTNSKTRRVTIP